MISKSAQQKLALLSGKQCISSLTQTKLKNKRVIVRIDANVPITNGKITDITRLKSIIPTIAFLQSKKVKQIILISHLGRPKGVDPTKSLNIVAKKLKSLLKQPVYFHDSHSHDKFLALSKEKRATKIVLLENLRFDEREEKNTTPFAKELAKFGDIYVNDAFGTAHRKHASNSAITKLLPSYTGLLIQTEITELGSIVTNPKRPFVVIIGFAKIADKITILEQLLKSADKLLIGGAISQTFFAAQGFEIGTSLVDIKEIPTAKKLLKKYGEKIVLPLDVTCAKTLSAKSNSIHPFDDIPTTEAVFDVGPQTLSLFASQLKNARNIFWNGPLGVCEIKPYDAQTNAIAKILAKSKAHTIIGGGDTAKAIVKSGYAKKMNHISTGGGASLQFIKNPILPAFTAILRSQKK